MRDSTARAEPADARDEVLRLRAQLEHVQGRRMDPTMLPAHPALARLLPGGGLRPGATYALGPSASLLLALLAPPSQAGSWCAAIGMPHLGAEAAERLGVDLSRFVLIPDAGQRWLAVTATVAEVVPVVAVSPPGRVTDAEAARLSARLRDRGAVLLVTGAWPQADARIDVSAAEWSGVGRGHGYLAGRELAVTVTGRRTSAPRKGRMLLPDASGGLTGSAGPVVTTASAREHVPVRALEAVG